MLRSLNELRKYKIRAADGDIGGVCDFFFDDYDWTVRYMVVDTGTWLPGRQVLISPVSIGVVDWTSRHIDVRLTQQQIKDSPGVENDAPISRIMEEQITQYYAWPMYWADYGGPTLPQADNSGVAVLDPPRVRTDTALRSAKQVTGYSIHASDGDIGHVEDFLCDDQAWNIRYMVVDTGNWIPGKKVLVAPLWIQAIDWAKSEVRVDMRRDTIKASPEFNPARLDRVYESLLHKHYGRKEYWLM